MQNLNEIVRTVSLPQNRFSRKTYLKTRVNQVSMKKCTEVFSCP